MRCTPINYKQMSRYQKSDIMVATVATRTSILDESITGRAYDLLKKMTHEAINIRPDRVLLSTEVHSSIHLMLNSIDGWSAGCRALFVQR